jgi:hypothetical protein
MCRGTEWHEDTRLRANLFLDELLPTPAHAASDRV